MANTLDIGALEDAYKMVTKFMEEVSENLSMAQKAAVDCNDNLTNSVTTQRALGNIENCIGKIRGSLGEADNLRNLIMKKIQEIQEAL